MVEAVPVREVGESRWEGTEILLVSDAEMGEKGREMVYGFIEVGTKREAANGEWKEVDGMIEGLTKGYAFESTRKMLYRLVEVVSKNKVSEKGREIVNWLIEIFAESQGV